MKIIKEPIYDKKVECEICGTQFEFDNDDLKKEIIAGGLDEKPFVIIRVCCPICTNMINVTNRIIKK